MKRVLISVAIILLVASAAILWHRRNHQLTGVVQASETVQLKEVHLYFDSKDSGPYVKGAIRVFMDPAVLLKYSGYKDSSLAALLFLGKEYEGKHIRVVGDVQTDDNGRRFICVTNTSQWTYR